MYAVKNAVGVHTRINETVLSRIDVMAAKRKVSRSQVIDEALTRFLKAGATTRTVTAKKAASKKAKTWTATAKKTVAKKAKTFAAATK